jgi:hypothetical protein
VLHGARRAVGAGITRVGDAHLHFDALDLWVADKGDGAFIVQAQKSVPGVFHTVHPVQRLQFHAELVGKELDLAFHVGSTQR